MKRSYAFIGLVVLFLGYVLISPLLSEQIKVISSSIEREGNGNVYVKGIVYNNNSTSVDADIEVTIFDKDHNLLDTSHLDLKDVPGKSERAFRTEAKKIPAAESYLLKASGGFRNPYGN